MCKYYLQEILLGGEFLCPLGRNLNRGMTRTSWPFRASSLAAVWMEWREEQLITRRRLFKRVLYYFRRETMRAAESHGSGCWGWSMAWRNSGRIESAKREFTLPF